MSDKYANFAELATSEPEAAWAITHVDRPTSDVLVIAPHGGGIEPFTSTLAAAIADEDYGLYCFEGLKPKDNHELHVTSHHFDEPIALSLVAQSSIVLAIHGCRGKNVIYVGGLDEEFVALLTAALRNAGLPAESTGHKYLAVEPKNICNRGRRKRGAQLEISRDLRDHEPTRARIAAAARGAIAKGLELMALGKAEEARAISQPESSWRIRFRFFVQKRLNISAKERQLRIGGRDVILRAELPDANIEDENWLTLNALAFASEQEARRFAHALKVTCEISSVSARLGVDSGIDVSTASVGEAIRSAARRLDGTIYRGNVHGVDVFAEDSNIKFPIVRGIGTVRAAPDPFLADLAVLFPSVGDLSQRSLDIALLLNYALTRVDPVAQIVFSISAVEMVGQYHNDWTDDQKGLLKTLADLALRSSLEKEQERNEVADAVRRGMHKIGLRQGVRRLLDSLGRSDLKKPWDDLYGKRSTLVHGLAPAPGVNYGPLADEAMNVCGQILLIALAKEIPHLDKHRDKFYPLRS